MVNRLNQLNEWAVKELKRRQWVATCDVLAKIEELQAQKFDDEKEEAKRIAKIEELIKRTKASDFKERVTFSPLEDLFHATLAKYATNFDHYERLMGYSRRAWWCPASPIMLSAYIKDALPISCFLNEPQDNLASITGKLSENMGLASHGGGVATYWGNIRGVGADIQGKGKTGGVIPFIKIQDAISHGISQGNIRQGSSAVYLPVWHSEIKEFINLRFAQSQDTNRVCPNVFPAVIIDDTFMHALETGEPYYIGKDVDKQIEISAKELWEDIIQSRKQRGVPYILFEGNLKNEKRFQPVKMSNLCTEILLPTGKDKYGKQRTAVCCLASTNVEYYDEWYGNEQFIQDVMEFLDNVLEHFIKEAKDIPAYQDAIYSVQRERSVGLGIMGLAYLYQKLLIPFESEEARELNERIVADLDSMTRKASERLARERGPCLDAFDSQWPKNWERFSHRLAIAPTSTISGLLNTSPSTEPVANCQNLDGGNGYVGFVNKYLFENAPQELHDALLAANGDVSKLPDFPHKDKLVAVFKGPHEISPLTIIERAADRQKYLDQGQSVNLWETAEPANWSRVYYEAWKSGVITLYYVYALRLIQGENLHEDVDMFVPFEEETPACSIDNPKCETCS